MLYSLIKWMIFNFQNAAFQIFIAWKWEGNGHRRRGVWEFWRASADSDSVMLFGTTPFCETKANEITERCGVGCWTWHCGVKKTRKKKTTPFFPSHTCSFNSYFSFTPARKRKEKGKRASSNHWVTEAHKIVVSYSFLSTNFNIPLGSGANIFPIPISPVSTLLP